MFTFLDFRTLEEEELKDWQLLYNCTIKSGSQSHLALHQDPSSRVDGKGICPHLTGWKNCAGYKKLARPPWTIWGLPLLLPSQPCNLEAGVSRLSPDPYHQSREGTWSELWIMSKDLGPGQEEDETLWFGVNMPYLCLHLTRKEWQAHLLPLVPSLVASTSWSTVSPSPHKECWEELTASSTLPKTPSGFLESVFSLPLTSMGQGQAKVYIVYIPYRITWGALIRNAERKLRS